MANADSTTATGNGTCFHREWSEVAEEPLEEQSAARIRTMTLNILADGLAAGGAPSDAASPLVPELFVTDERAGGVALLDETSTPNAKFSFTFRCPAEEIQWQRRWPMLLASILEQEPDVIGLQEVDLAPGDRQGKNPAHDKEIQKDLAKAGYDGCFACKFGKACDGVALFWRRERLRPAGRSLSLGVGSVHVALAQPLVLEDSWHFTAVATHLKAGLNNDAENMRLKQAQSLMQQLKGHENVVLLADLNAHCRPWVDDEKSTITPRAYPFLANRLCSAYKEVLGEEPGFTSWGGWADRDVRGVFDYIFFRGKLFKPLRVLQAPAATDVLQFSERMPNPEHPTDHVPMVADFLVTGESTEPEAWQEPVVNSQNSAKKWQQPTAKWQPWQQPAGHWQQSAGAWQQRQSQWQQPPAKRPRWW